MPIRKLFLFALLFFCVFSNTRGQEAEMSELSDLTVEKIMRDPRWMGVSPSEITWSEDGQRIYFNWNPEKAESDSLYVVSRNGGTPRKVSLAERRVLPASQGDYDRSWSRKVYEKDGDIFLLDIKRWRIRQITRTVEVERNPRFTADGKKVTYIKDRNLYLWHIDNGEIVQLTDFRDGFQKSEKEEPKIDQEKWLKKEEAELVGYLKKQADLKKLSEKNKKAVLPERPKKIFVEDKVVQDVQLSPGERFITFVLNKPARQAKRTMVPNYIHETGFTEVLDARTKVGSTQSTYQLGVYDIKEDTVLFVCTEDIPGIYDRPAYLETYDEAGSEEDAQEKSQETEKSEQKSAREVMFPDLVWAEDEDCAVVSVMAQDHKDRWIMLLEPDSARLRLLDRQHDDAWIGGPGIRRWRRQGPVLGWMPDGRRVWFQSEASGTSHLYTVDIQTGEKTALTSGPFEVYTPRISRDKKQWTFTSNEAHPGERHFYRMPIDGGKAVQTTRMEGSNQVFPSPDGKMLAVCHSVSNRPWELFIMENKTGAPAKRITHSLSPEFLSYPWRQPDVITFPARDGARVHARLYRPANPEPGGPAVIFVHGAGYLQNAHKWWSHYFREYMFHNLLVDHGYTVLDIDYRASAGYGRDWRTAIYRHMGGKDLTDQVDGARFLVEACHVDPKRIGIYGGSYGGFITLMALFTEPDVFAAGAALRPVTDWAHYNHWYTSNILNVPYADSLAYVRSSPIYHAEGLKGALLMCHGMVDVNVHFQDVVRLSQRLIELGKENWELAVYPVEGHGFREPSSWTDEYRRIFTLFEENLK